MLCWIGVVISLMTLDAIALFGIKDPVYKLMGWLAHVLLCDNVDSHNLILMN